MESPSLGMFTKLRRKLVKGKGYEVDFERLEQENIGPQLKKYERSRSSSLEKQRKNRIINGEPVTWHNYTYDICLQSETIPSKPRSAPSTPVKKREENIAKLNYPKEYTEGYKYETKHRSYKNSNRADPCVKYYATHSGNKSTKIGISRDKVADQNICPIHNPNSHSKPKERASKSLPQDTNICPVHPNRSWSYTDHAKTTGRIKNKEKSFENTYNTQPKRKQKPLSLNNSQGQRPPNLPKKQQKISLDEIDSASANSSNNFSLGKEIEQKIANIATVSVPNKEDTIAQYQITVTVNKIETPSSSVQSSAVQTPVTSPDSLQFPIDNQEPVKTEDKDTTKNKEESSPEKKPDIIENHTVNKNDTYKSWDTILCGSCGKNTDNNGTESKSNSLVKSPALEQRKHESPLPVQKVKPEVKVPFRPISKEKKEQLELAKSIYQTKSGETTPDTQENIMSKSFEGFLNEKREKVSCYAAVNPTENGAAKQSVTNIGPSSRKITPKVEMLRNKDVSNRNRSVSCGDSQSKEVVGTKSIGATTMEYKPKPRRLHSYSGYEDIKENTSKCVVTNTPYVDDAYEDVEPPPQVTQNSKTNEVTVDVEVHREFLTYAELENPSNVAKNKLVSPRKITQKEEPVPYADIAINRLSSINQNVERMISRESGYETSENHTGSLERLQLTKKKKVPTATLR